MREEIVACEQCGTADITKNEYSLARKLCEACEYENQESQEYLDEIFCNSSEEDAGEAWDSYDDID